MNTTDPTTPAPAPTSARRRAAPAARCLVKACPFITRNRSGLCDGHEQQHAHDAATERERRHLEATYPEQ